MSQERQNNYPPSVYDLIDWYTHGLGAHEVQSSIYHDAKDLVEKYISLCVREWGDEFLGEDDEEFIGTPRELLVSCSHQVRSGTEFGVLKLLNGQSRRVNMDIPTSSNSPFSQVAHEVENKIMDAFRFSVGSLIMSRGESVVANVQRDMVSVPLNLKCKIAKDITNVIWGPNVRVVVK